MNYIVKTINRNNKEINTIYFNSEDEAKDAYMQLVQTRLETITNVADGNNDLEYHEDPDDCTRVIRQYVDCDVAILLKMEL